MNKRELRKAVLRGLADELTSGAIQWVNTETAADDLRLEFVCDELAAEFARRGLASRRDDQRDDGNDDRDVLSEHR